jgi:helix-turn-helix protein
MSESVVADFVAKFTTEGSASGKPVAGRILLSEKRLVLAANDDEKVTIPLSTVSDVAVDHVPADLGDFFESTVTIAYQRGGTPTVAVVEADDDTIGKFETVLFKVLLNDTDATIRSPARVGGRVTETAFRAAKLLVESDAVRFNYGDGAVEIPLSTVSGFDLSEREIVGETRPTLDVRHVRAGRSTTTVASIGDSRKMSILGRYIRTEYGELLAELEDVELTRDRTQVLLALFSGAGGSDLSVADVVDKDPSQVTTLLEELNEDDLVDNVTDDPTLTRKGRVAVNDNFEDAVP